MSVTREGISYFAGPILITHQDRKKEKKNKKKLEYKQFISKYLDLEKGGKWEMGRFYDTFFFDVACTPGIEVLSELRGGGWHCVLKWGFMRTFPGNQDATFK